MWHASQRPGPLILSGTVGDDQLATRTTSELCERAFAIAELQRVARALRILIQ